MSEISIAGKKNTETFRKEIFVSAIALMSNYFYKETSENVRIKG